MEDLLKELMNKGFLIFEDNAKFVLCKIPTPADTRAVITEEIVSDASRLLFDSFVSALSQAKVMINWTDKETMQTQLSDTIWVMQMMYQIPSGPKFIELGEMGSVSYDVAVKEARMRADRYIEESLLAEDIAEYDVRIRPARKV